MSDKAVSTSTKTHTKREGSGANAITKTITEETTVYADGRKKTTTKETITSGGSSKTITDSHDKLSSRFEQLRAGNDNDNGWDSKPKSHLKDHGKSDVKPQSASEFIDACVDAHNKYRTKHGVPPLKHSKDVTKFAQKWAEHLVKANTFEHSSCVMKNGEKLGENIASKGGSGHIDYTGQEVTDQWYAEFPKYDFSNPEGNRNSNHFSQVVWKGSKELGIGKAKSSRGDVIVVACYLPAGNMRGDYRDNVLPLKK